MPRRKRSADDTKHASVVPLEHFVPVLSKDALANFANLKQRSPCDNVLLEYTLALELKARGQLRAIFPVFVGDVKSFGDLGELRP